MPAEESEPREVTEAAVTSEDPRSNNIATARSALELAGLVLAPTTLLVSLLLYFGWVRTNAIFSYFGVDQRLLAYDRQDYLLRSTGVAFRPTVILLLSGAVALASFLVVKTILTRVPHHRRWLVLGAVAAVGLCALVAAVARVVDSNLPGPPAALAAFLLGAGAATLEGVVTLSGWQEWRAARRIILAGLVLVSVFWSFAVAAQSSGTSLARYWAGTPGTRPAITLISTQDLALQDSPGVRVEQVTPTGAHTLYRYTGLRLLVYSNDRWFLYSDDWGQAGARKVFVVRDSTELRVEAAPADQRPG